MQMTWRLVGVVVLSAVLSGASFAAPSITSLSPTSGVVGASVTITGTNFGSTQGTSTEKLTAAPPTHMTSGGPPLLETTEPTGATTGNVVTNVGGANSIWATAT